MAATSPWTRPLSCIDCRAATTAEPILWLKSDRAELSVLRWHPVVSTQKNTTRSFGCPFHVLHLIFDEFNTPPTTYDSLQLLCAFISCGGDKPCRKPREVLASNHGSSTVEATFEDLNGSLDSSCCCCCCWWWWWWWCCWWWWWWWWGFFWECGAIKIQGTQSSPWSVWLIGSIRMQ